MMTIDGEPVPPSVAARGAVRIAVCLERLGMPTNELIGMLAEEWESAYVSLIAAPWESACASLPESWCHEDYL